MANGLVHDTLHRYFIFPSSFILGGIFYVVTKDLWYSTEIFIMFYLAQQFNRLCTPDSDDNGKTYQDFLTNMLDPYFSKVWYIIFWIYGKTIPHRHWLSHGLIIGAIIRLFYLFIILFPVIMYFNLIKYFYYYYDYTLIFICGYIAGDIYHLSLDYIIPFRRLVERMVE